MDATPGWDCHVHVFDGGQGSRAGHYAPPVRSTSMLEAVAADLPVSRFVLVQPSVYGTDNRLLLDTLRRGAGRHRGVVVLDPSVDDTALQAMHDLGVRGVRFNLVSPVGNAKLPSDRLALRLRELGWHVQWFAAPGNLAEIAAFQQRHALTCVLDHLGGLSAPAARDATVWADLGRIAEGGGWLKLSGWYRLGSVLPYADLHETIRHAAVLFGDRTVWGSDWPHTYFMEPGRHQPSPAYGDTWQPVPLAIGPRLADQVLRLHPQRLYA